MGTLLEYERSSNLNKLKLNIVKSAYKIAIRAMFTWVYWPQTSQASESPVHKICVDTNFQNTNIQRSRSRAFYGINSLRKLFYVMVHEELLN